ncbi:MAG: hypothetical protein ABSG90_09920 [Dehalococcoidia bacterium]|jgi:hypothetical protein
MSKTINEQMQELTDFGLISRKYRDFWEIAMSSILTEIKANEHGESPTIGKGYVDIQNDFIANKEQRINFSPFYEIANWSAMAQLITDNNHQLIVLMEAMIDNAKLI